jgi:hypothetical protein
MARMRGNGAPRRSDDNPRGSERHITVRCPNRTCAMVYYVAAQYAGKKARCAECGTPTRIPGGRSQGRTRSRNELPAESARRADRRGDVRIGCIGRGHAGKTALLQVLSDSLVGDFLPSGLHLDAGDPREVARMIHEAQAAQRLLHESGLPPTLQVSQTRYCIYKGDQRRVVCRMREVIGQILTHTLPDSEPRVQARYVDYLKNLVNANVLWTVIPCPPADPDARDRRRYANDLRITMAYLREALRLRTLKRPAAVALVLSKLDVLFDTPGQARAALTEDVLRNALGPLIQLVEQSSRVSDAAILPVTAFGFGKAVRREDGLDRHEAPGSSEEPFGDEPIWLLREGELPAPYNLDALFLWSLLLGLLNQASSDPKVEAEFDAICRMLRDDLETGDPWIVPVKGGVALTTTERAHMTTAES